MLEMLEEVNAVPLNKTAPATPLVVAPPAPAPAPAPTAKPNPQEKPLIGFTNGPGMFRRALEHVM